MALIINNREISPCIVAKVKFALGLSTYKPLNNKTCSKKYWNEIIEYFTTPNNSIDKIIIQKAKDSETLYRKLKVVVE